MSIHVALRHHTQYQYDRTVALSPQVVRLRPAPHCRTPILSYSMRVTPSEHFVNWQQDAFSNHLARLVFPEKTQEFDVVVDLVADMRVINPFDFFLEDEAREWPFPYGDALRRELAPFLKVSPGPLVSHYVASVSRASQPTVSFLMELNQRVQRDIHYIIRMEPGVQTSEETLRLRSGSCRDSAWLLVEILRSLGLAARFVSGYLIQLTADVKSLDGPSGPESDFTDLHAWTEVYLPGAGWMGFDPTSGLAAGEGHIPLACTAEATSAAPISGSVETCLSTFEHHMSVTRIYETPRVTKPYTELQWSAIERLGFYVDSELSANDVRLTMGGEPTFVGIDHVDAPEWNVAALGDEKWQRAVELFHRLSNRFTIGALAHVGSGKWYPGEQLPRWALDCYWRKDGVPIWRRPELAGDPCRSYGMDSTYAERFARMLAARLRIAEGYVIPGYEDIHYYLWREQRLPTNVTVSDARVKDPLERARIARVFEQGLGEPVGYALPLRRQMAADGLRWFTGPWAMRPGRMFLIPGDSPMGYRLPLDSLPWVNDAEYPSVVEVDPMSPRRPLPSYFPMEEAPAPLSLPASANSAIAFNEGRRREQARILTALPTPPHGAATFRMHESASGVVRTALCVEARGGRLYVFMPPVECVEDYLDLLTAVEDTAESLNVPVIIEGYRPPEDDRICHFSIKPDPGVIEVNIHPAYSWLELVRNTATVYEEARQSRLAAEKFMLDGRHTGSGGGNHIVLGGPSPAESPFLRRPDLLRSLVAYWHNHPSLSYLFAGLFVGPTSQAPRVDEGRNDMVAELELAFRQIDTSTGSAPWFVDRALRNLLVDVTGNTHRAEFCIDKLFSPDSASGRQGLVEMRALEMPPHPRMSLAQQLLIRALVARFWITPYTVPLVRWHTALHDRFMLPHFVEQDFADVLDDQRRQGYPFDMAWYRPHLEFRFPLCGAVAYDGVTLELRTAIEPWHVLGEEPGSGAMSRYIDSSVERLQVKVRGMVDSRHAVTCNGQQIPLHPTGVTGEYVAGVRYQAWAPPSCLHPNVPINTPLVFDVVDLWNGRSVGGCVYHVAHPGGVNYERFPVNAFEAEARRGGRFAPIGHTSGPMTPAPGRVHPEYPLTLDLRWSGV